MPVVEVDCGEPDVSAESGVIVIGTNFSYGSEVTFECNMTGYTAIPADAFCMADGNWSMKSSPTCHGEFLLDI